MKKITTINEALSVSDLTAGDEVILTGKLAGGINIKTKFLGFTSNEDKYSEEPKFDTIKDVFKEYDVKSLKDIEDKVNGKPSYGYDVYAVFRDVDDDDNVWTAHIYKGKWAGGSSSDPVQIKRA